LKFPLQIINEHLFIELRDGLYLIDTGAAGSFSQSLAVCFSDEHSYSVPNEFLGVNCALLDKYIHCESAGLIGANLLSKFALGINLSQGCLVLEDAFQADDFKQKPQFFELNFQLRQSLLLMEFEVENKMLRLFVDTGAPSSYLQPDFEGGVAKGKVSDFHPFIGAFESENRSCELLIGSNQHQWDFALMPEALNRAVASAEGQGLMGLDLFRNYEIWIDYQNKKAFLNSVQHR